MTCPSGIGIQITASSTIFTDWTLLMIIDRLEYLNLLLRNIKSYGTDFQI